MHLVIHDVSGLSKVDRVDDFVVSIFFVSVQILRLTAVARIVEEQRIVRTRVFHQPVHRSEDVGLCRLAHRVLLIVRQDHHILSLVPKMPVQVGGHILHVVDTAAKLSSLREIIDAYEKGFPTPGTVRVLECVAAGSAVPKILGLLRWRWWCVVTCTTRKYVLRVLRLRTSYLGAVAVVAPDRSSVEVVGSYLEVGRSLVEVESADICFV